MLKVLKAVFSGFLLLGSSSWEKETGWKEPRTKDEMLWWGNAENGAGWVQAKRWGMKCITPSSLASFLEAGTKS